MNNNYFNTELPKPLSKEELYKNIIKKKNGDKNARNILIKHNLRMVVKLVNRYFNDTIYEKEDLISIATIGLTKGIDSFDLGKHTNFTTYVGTCIINEIRMFIRKNQKNIVADSLDRKIINEDGYDMIILDTIQDDNDFTLECEDKEAMQVIKNMIDSLDGKEKYIIELYFGLNHNKQYKQPEIAEMLNLSQSRISRIIKNELNAIKYNLEKLDFIENKNLIKGKKSLVK